LGLLELILQISFHMTNLNLVHLSVPIFNMFININIIKLGNNSKKERKIWPLELKSNFHLPIKFKNFSLDNDFISIHNFSSNNIVNRLKSSSAILNVAVQNFSRVGKSVIFLNYLGFNIPVTFLLYDAKLEVIYFDKKINERLIEKCDAICDLIKLDFEVFSNEEKRMKKFRLSNHNPTSLDVKLANFNSTAIFLELDSYYDENKIKFLIKKNLILNEDFKICSFCFVEINVKIRNEKSQKEVFFLEFVSSASKSFHSFKIYGNYETINGSLLIPSLSNIRFQPGFPGIVQSKFISIKSSFQIDCKVLEVESADPRIIPYIIKAVIAANSKEEFIKVVFDPSTLQKDHVDNFSFIYFIVY